jgi:chlorite dismutase
MGFLVSNVLAYRLDPSWWKLGKEERKEILDVLRRIIDAARGGQTGSKAALYSSLRYDCSIIIWLLMDNPQRIAATRASIERLICGYASIKYGFLSVYENKNKDSGNRKYFVAYPISKDPEWYLLDRSKRSDIMAEHISMATSNKNNKGINSYTTLSFGIDDNEFVVLYELDSLHEWVKVTQDLREASARKWITNERPILVGIDDLGPLLA